MWSMKHGRHDRCCVRCFLHAWNREKGRSKCPGRGVGLILSHSILAAPSACDVPSPCGLLFTPEDNVGKNCLFREMKQLAQGQS